MDRSEQGNILHSINDKEQIVFIQNYNFSNRILHHGLVYTCFLTATEKRES